MAPTPSSTLSPEQTPGPRYQTTILVSAAARQLYTQLPYSTPKGASNEEWQASFKKTLERTHRVVDKVFRAVVEDWKPSGSNIQLSNSNTVEDEVQELEDDIMGLSPWSGIFAGGERLVNLLKLIEAYLGCATAGPISLNVGAITDLLMRLLSVTVPSTSVNKDLQNYVRFNNQVSKDERENLWLILPKVHVAAIEMLLALSRRVDDCNTSIDSITLDQLAMLFTAEKATAEVRTACYMATTQILKRSGITLPKSSIEPLSTLIRSCCDDILPVDKPDTTSKQTPQQDKANGKAKQASMNADTFLNSSNAYQNPAANFAGLQEAAHALVTALVSNIPHHLSDSLRTRLDRTAILAGHKDAMIASVLNPPPSKKFGKPVSSILPLLARTNFGDAEVEALLKPRMPVIRIGRQDPDAEDVEMEEEDEDEEDEEDEDDDEEEEDEQEEDAPSAEQDDANKFIGHELDSLLETATENHNKDISMTSRPAVPIPSFNNARFDAPPPSSSSSTTTTHNTSSKRPQDAIQPPPSPAKRPRIEQDPTPVQVAPPADGTSAAAAEVVVTTASQMPATAPAKEESEDDDDDEDVVPLVFGQDTDDEDEE